VGEELTIVGKKVRKKEVQGGTGRYRSYREVKN
jgi:hypothetical protein